MSVQKWPQVMVFVANICCCYLKRKKEEKKLKKKIEKKIVTSFFIFSLITVLHPGQAVKILAHPVSKLNFELVLLRDKKSYPIGNPTLDPQELLLCTWTGFCTPVCHAMLESHAMEVSTKHNSALQFQLQRCTLARKNTQVHKEVVPGFNSDHDIQSVN